MAAHSKQHGKATNEVKAEKTHEAAKVVRRPAYQAPQVHEVGGLDRMQGNATYDGYDSVRYFRYRT